MRGTVPACRWMAVPAALLALVLLSGCGQATPEKGAGRTPDAGAAALSCSSGSGPCFTEVAATAGLDFVHVSGAPRDKRAIYESASGGVAWLDHDGDGWQDLYLVNSGRTLRSSPPPEQERTSGALFRNLGDGHFTEVTAAAGLSDWRWGMGAAVADFDNDGDADLYVTHLGPNALWRNNGDGTFTDIAAAAGVDDDGPGSGAAFADIDADGWLDLYVGNYVDVVPDLPLPSSDELCTYRGLSVYCGPRGLPAAPDVLFRNLGNGRFEDVSVAAGIANVSPRHSYDVLFTDLENDGDADIYVAADQMPSLLFINDGRGHFEEAAMLAGVALGEAGLTQAGMGVDVADIDGDGLPDLVKTNFESEANNLYMNSATGLFADRAYQAGLSATMPHLGWGILFIDADQDGYLDLYVANGHVFPQVESGGMQREYAQRNMLFAGGQQQGRPYFIDISARAGAGLQARGVSRGVAAADYDGDGDLDLAINNLDAGPHLLRNDTPTAGAWLEVRVLGTATSRDAYGARVEVQAGGRTQVREVRASRGFLSSSDAAVHFGLGAALAVERLEVVWPGGGRETFPPPRLNSRVRLRQGDGALP